MRTIPGSLLSAVNDRFDLNGNHGEVLVGGTASTVWRLDSVPPVVVRLSRFLEVDDLQRGCRVADAFARTIPEAVRPLVGVDGGSVFLWDGHPVTVWPYVDGSPLDRRDPAQLRQAADLLARLHQAGLACRDLGDRWTSDRQDAEAARLLPDRELDEWLCAWESRYTAEEPAGWMHRDFFPGNILCRQGTVAGLIDWDEAEWGPMIAELAWSVWELGKSPAGDTLLLDPAHEFLTAYQQAGGPVEPSDALIPLIRDRLRRGLAFWTRVRAAGHEVDPIETEAMASAFTSLRSVRLPPAGEPSR